MIMKSYLDMREAERQRVDSAARLYLEELLSEFSRTKVIETLRVRTYQRPRSYFEKGVLLRAIQLMEEGFNV